MNVQRGKEGCPAERKIGSPDDVQPVSSVDGNLKRIGHTVVGSDATPVQ